MHTTFDSLPLRAQKRARTRADLVHALVTRLEQRPLEDIGVAELCKDAGISQATFFNYFPSKPDLLTHFIRLWSLKVAVIAAEAEASTDSPLAAIEALFASTAADTAPRIQLMLETIRHQARMPAALSLPPIELAERLLLLPGVDDVMSLPDTGLGGILPVLLAKAMAAGELPPSASVQSLTLAVASVFFGVPLILGRSAPEAIAPTFQQQLQLIWAGARGV